MNIESRLKIQRTLCRIGWHDWSRWKRVKQYFHDKPQYLLGHRVGTVAAHSNIYMQRECLCCGIWKVEGLEK